ncbi:MAG TPA: serine/threonine-protein kinase [Ktedonobacteraceae bacterium]
MLIDPRAFIGQTIANRYTIEDLIGQGGMGYVYLARDRMSGHVCALKMFLPQRNSERSADTYRRFLSRFKREYNIVDAARHPNIIQVYSRGEYQGVAYFVMEYFPHGSLSDRIENFGKISPREACAYIKQAASALDYIHARGVIHRDIKPQNMLIDKQGDLILADFGVAHIAGSILTLTDQPGTKIYKSPQARLDLPPEPRDDIFSLGVVLYEMLTGNEPHLRYIRSMGPEIPDAIQPIILKATADERGDRYPTARALARDLEKALGRRQKPDRGGTQTYQAVDYRPLKKLPKPGKADGNFSPFLKIAFTLVSLLVLLISFLLLQHALARPSAVALLSFPSTSAVVSSSTPAPAAQEQAIAAVQQYYLDWNKQQYQAAYALLQAAYQQQYSFDALLPFYQQTRHVCITITRTSPQTSNTFQVQVTDNAIEDASTGGTVVNLYYVIYDVRWEQNSWKIAPTSLHYAGETGTCNP